VQDYQSLIDEYQEVMKMQGRDNLSEEELNQLKEQVWNNLLRFKLIENEAEKLGLTVTNEELSNVLKDGKSNLLYQLPLLPDFLNQQTRQFDYSQVSMIYNNLKQQMNNTNPQIAAQAAEQFATFDKYWQFIEKSLRQQMLVTKYQALLSGSLLSNPVSAKASFNNQNTESNILLASMPYSAINDNDVAVSDADLKAKFNEQKEMYKQYVETRDIKYVSYRVTASASDRAELMATMQDAAAKLQNGEDAATVVRKAQSQVPYLGLPVTRDALPYDIANRLDSMAVGQTTAPFESTSDNTLNVIKLISKVELPDSIEYRIISVGGSDIDAARKTADSIMTAIRGGVDFDTLAVKYNKRTATKQFMTSAMYQGQTVLDADSKNVITALNTLGKNEMKSVEMSQGMLIIQVTDRRDVKTKYDLAVVKHTIDFSRQTYSDAYNKFSQFVSENQTVDGLEKNAAQAGFTVMDRTDMTNSEHNVANLRATREALKWIFDAKEGEVSPLYECGNNDCLLVVAMTKIHEKGYRDWESLKDELRSKVMRDKKFDLQAEKLKDVKSIADAQSKGARIDTVRQITFAAPVYVQATSASEPALSGAVAATESGAFSKSVVKGNAGAYVFQVLDQKQREGVTLDEKREESRLRQQAMQAVSNFLQELYLKADITDNRYLFF
jgi:peptidyl-prolyl cis-trans isomerase D